MAGYMGFTHMVWIDTEIAPWTLNDGDGHESEDMVDG